MGDYKYKVQTDPIICSTRKHMQHKEVVNRITHGIIQFSAFFQCDVGMGNLKEELRQKGLKYPRMYGKRLDAVYL